VLDSPARWAIRAKDAWFRPRSAIVSIAAATICARRALAVKLRSAVGFTRMSKHYRN
jgi:hypothetical protein